MYSERLERAIRYAVEHQGLLRAIEIAQNSNWSSRTSSYPTYRTSCAPLTCIHQCVTLFWTASPAPWRRNNPTTSRPC